MSKHDTWVELITPSPFDPIKHFFPQGFPMRDPFPALIAGEDNDPIWIMDMNRLEEAQVNAIANQIAYACGEPVEAIISVALEMGGFGIKHCWVQKMYGGAENYQRTLEFALLNEQYPDPTIEQWQGFMEQQYNDWIDGDRTPDPLPEKFEDVHPLMQTPELEQHYKQVKLAEFLESKNYSVMDVLLGDAVVDGLNFIDPEGGWEKA